ncbi:MAG: exosortase/archaeosortase family protein [Candidatus Omnitrophica bacterium]|nr:exosortase/archaeosortase family protein [Candidatus Omnitrophota bacterium]
MSSTVSIKLAIIIALLLLIYWPTFVWMNARFLEVDSYYSHGFLIPFVFSFLIWKKRKELKKAKIVPLNIGLLLIIPALFIHLAAYRWGVNFISGFSFIITLFGLSLYLFGREMTQKMTFPFCFLVFMVPLPQVLIIHISFNLKIFAAQIATSIIKLINIPSVRQGSIVYLPNTSLTIGEPCSGLRSLISLTALGALYAHLAKISLIKKIILFSVSIPLALLANIIRIVLLLIVAFVYGSEVATGKFHDFSGFLLFIFALIGLVIVERTISWQKKN